MKKAKVDYDSIMHARKLLGESSTKSKPNNSDSVIAKYHNIPTRKEFPESSFAHKLINSPKLG